MKTQAKAITVRVSAAEFHTLSAQAEEQKKNVTRYVTQIVKDGLLKKTDSDRLEALEGRLIVAVTQVGERVSALANAKPELPHQRFDMKQDSLAISDPGEDIAIWLMASWPMSRWGVAPAISASALRDWRAALADMTISEINRAIALCETRPSPPDPVSFSGAGTETA